jgi:hypothetical protein
LFYYLQIFANFCNLEAYLFQRLVTKKRDFFVLFCPNIGDSVKYVYSILLSLRPQRIISVSYTYTENIQNKHIFSVGMLSTVNVAHYERRICLVFKISKPFSSTALFLTNKINMQNKIFFTIHCSLCPMYSCDKIIFNSKMTFA